MKPIKAAIVSVSGTSLTDDEKYMIEKDNPLGIALFGRNIDTPSQLRELTNSIKQVANRDNIIIAIDQEGGRVCRLKPPHFRHYSAQSEIASLDLNNAIKMAKLHAELIADDLHNVGVNCNFAPTLDVATPLISKALKSRCFSRNINTTAVLGKTIFETYSNNSIIACIKHLPGHSGADKDPHLQLPIIRRTFKKHFYPFEQIAPHALMAMTAHIVLCEFDNVPITMSKTAISKLIRKQLGFKGLLISDALEMKALSGSLTEKTVTSISAGCDAVCYCMGDINGVRMVLDNCGYLNEKALENHYKLSGILNCKYKSSNIADKVIKYENYAKKTKVAVDDYDAVEVLMELQKSIK